MPYISRTIEPAITAFIAAREPHKNVLLVEGTRQVGKTSLVEHALAASGCAANLERDTGAARSLIDFFDRFLETGGLPAAVIAHAAGQDHREILGQIAADYE